MHMKIIRSIKKKLTGESFCIKMEDVRFVNEEGPSSIDASERRFFIRPGSLCNGHQRGGKEHGCN